MVQGIISSIIIGAIIGALARLIMPGRQNISVVATVVVGIIAALIGTAIAAALHVNHTSGINWIQLFIELALAVIGVSIAARRTASRQLTRR